MSRIEIRGPLGPRYEEILTPEALAFIAELHSRFAGVRHDRLLDRQKQRAEFSNGRNPGFRPETASVRNDPAWKVAGAGPGLEDRRVEITGPVDQKMAINALNSDARVWLADLEDATSPTWANVIEGQVNLRDAIRGELEFTNEAGKHYSVGAETPTIVVRPRGWHLTEKHLRYFDRFGQGTSASASLVDFGLFFFHNAKALIEQGRGPYFYLPKLENHLEARLWNEVFEFAQEYVGLRRGTIRATVLIETITAAFEMEEILYELRDHCAGLNAGRWDYIFSIIKNFRNRARFVTPDRKNITMTAPFIRAYTELLVATCHRRGAHAIGGMSAFIPDRRNPEVTERALEQVHADKTREANDGYDGTWVAHPDLIPTARAVFDQVLGSRPNQVSRQRDDVSVTAAELVDLGSITSVVTDEGLRSNVRIALRYIEAWLRGNGAVAIDHLMEDAATAEISRSQVWQWIHHEARTAEGTAITVGEVERLIEQELGALDRQPEDRFDDAVSVFRQVALAEELPTFLTIAAYTQFLVEPATTEQQRNAA
ncbi:malate synthase A [Saxibacter everestensis]|uniref:Malate synthase n=1 Tax=Saxibacter everestensis TaxID=2909229 RepID=A0ABY8QV23_9MICO|nr:malate synthase A [Brevibacteriaceae bacterium ZFBP1038]